MAPQQYRRGLDRRYLFRRLFDRRAGSVQPHRPHRCAPCLYRRCRAGWCRRRRLRPLCRGVLVGHGLSRFRRHRAGRHLHAGAAGAYRPLRGTGAGARRCVLYRQLQPRHGAFVPDGGRGRADIRLAHRIRGGGGGDGARPDPRCRGAPSPEARAGVGADRASRLPPGAAQSPRHGLHLGVRGPCMGAFRLPLLDRDVSRLRFDLSRPSRMAGADHGGHHRQRAGGGDEHWRAGIGHAPGPSAGGFGAYAGLGGGRRRLRFHGVLALWLGSGPGGCLRRSHD